MIVKGFYRTREDGVNLYLTKSTDGFMIRKVGTDEVYDEAIDVENSGFEYEEFVDNGKETVDEIITAL